MIMDHAFYLDFLWNNHSWYKIENLNDFIRALLWCAANAITAFSYLAIPWEIWLWRKVLPFFSTNIVGIGFVSFIVACGLHHLVDIVIMPTAPWWAILWVNIPMAIVSAATWIYIRVNRGMIIKILRAIVELIEKKNKAEALKVKLERPNGH